MSVPAREGGNAVDSRASQDALRLRTLATAAPLHRVAAAATGALGALSHEDLAIHALGTLLDTWRLGNDEELLDKAGLAQKVGERVLEQAAALRVAVDRRSAVEFGGKVVEILLNARHRGEPFRSAIYDPVRRVHETYEFSLVEEAESDDNRFYLEPTAEASNLYFQSFLVDVQDELVAQRAVLQHHIAAGRTDRLCTAAEGHRRTASRLVSEAKVIARKAERSIRSVSPTDEAIPLLRRFEAAATEAARFDDDIARKIADQMEIAEGEAAENLAATGEHIRKARRAFQRALLASTDLIARLERAAAAAAFRIPPGLAVIPDIEAEVALPLLSLPVGDPALDAVLAAFLGASPAAGALPDPCRLAEAWLPRPRLEDPDSGLADEPELEAAPALCPPRFGDRGGVAEALAFVVAHGVRAGSLSRLLRHPGAAERPEAFAEAVALVTAAAFKDQGGSGRDVLRLPGVRLRMAGRPLPDETPVQGDDILIEAAA